MLRTLLLVVILLFSVIWLPVWAQGAIFIISLFFAPKNIFLVIPAVFADALYSVGSYSISSFKYTIFAVLLILLYRFILNRLRI